MLSATEVEQTDIRENYVHFSTKDLLEFYSWSKLIFTS